MKLALLLGTLLASASGVCSSFSIGGNVAPAAYAKPIGAARRKIQVRRIRNTFTILCRPVEAARASNTRCDYTIICVFRLRLLTSLLRRGCNRCPVFNLTFLTLSPLLLQQYPQVTCTGLTWVLVSGVTAPGTVNGVYIPYSGPFFVGAAPV